MFDIEVGNELFYFVFMGEPQPLNGYIQLDNNSPGLGLAISEKHLTDFNIIEQRVLKPNGRSGSGVLAARAPDWLRRTPGGGAPPD